MTAAKGNPAIEALAPLVGRWATEMVFPGKPEPFRGEVSFAWIDGGAFLEMRSEGEPGGPPRSVAVIGHDQDRHGYQMLYFDERGVSRIYAMAFDGMAWALSRDQGGFAQRFEARISDDGATISGSWSKSSEGAPFEHDFAITYRRMPT